jgi:hypothetical protein
VQAILAKFDNVRATPTGWNARCPAHKDKKNSLSLGIGDEGQVLVNCFVGCDLGMVLYHKGLQFKDLYPPRGEKIRSNGHGSNGCGRRPELLPPSDPQADAPPKPQARVISTIRDEIRDPSGTVVAIHVRRDYDDGTKAVHWEQPDRSMGLGGQRVESLPLYGIHKLGSAPTVFICEGEKAAKALRDMGVAAVGTVTGAAGCPNDDSLRPLLGRVLVLWPDNDEPGSKHMDAIGARLRAMGQPESHLFHFDWADAPEKGDSADYAERGGTKSGLGALVESSAQPWRPRPAASAAAPGPSSSAAAGGASTSLGREPSQATRLVALATKGDTELFHDTTGDCFITFDAGDHRETHLLRSRAVKLWLSRLFRDAEDTTPGGSGLTDALVNLEGMAQFDGLCRPAFVRLATDETGLYLDLANESWQVVHITADDWTVIAGDDAPVRFRRPRGLLPLPTPERGGDLQPLRDLLNVSDDDGFTLIVGWLLGALNPTGSYPILVLHGEQGSSKTTAGRLLRSLIDPNIAALRRPPTLEDDLLIAAKNGLVVGYDNLSTVQDWLSDSLCRLTTGGGLGKRALFTDVDEVLLDARRPVLMTGIASMLTRGDALDRALLSELAQFKAGKRRTEAVIWAEFERARPKLLGLLLTAASTALRNRPTTHISNLPRMADFALWVEAGAPAFGWEPGYFAKTYDTNRKAANEITIDASAAGVAVQAFMDNRTMWQGTATELLGELNAAAGETKRPEGWPKKAHSLSAELKRLAPSLRQAGISVEFMRETTGAKRRLTTLTTTKPGSDDSSSEDRTESASLASPAALESITRTTTPMSSADVAKGEASPSVVRASLERASDASDAQGDAQRTTEASLAPNENPYNDDDSLSGCRVGDASDASDADLSLSSQGALFGGGAVIECQACCAVVNTRQRYCPDCDPRGG